MPGSDFLGTNVLVYAYDASDRAKQRIAQSLVRRAIAAEMVTSTHALAEFAATLPQKLSPAARPAARPADVAAILDMLGAIIAIRRMPTVSGERSRRTPKYGTHFYDGKILAAAERAACARILSEDLNPGQSYLGITVESLGVKLPLSRFWLSAQDILFVAPKK